MPSLRLTFVCVKTMVHLGPVVLLSLGSEVAGHIRSKQELALKSLTGGQPATHVTPLWEIPQPGLSGSTWL